MGARRGARSQASSRPVPAEDDVPQLERRTKRRNDPAEQPGSSSASQPAAKRGRPSSSGRGRVSRPENPGSSSGHSTESSLSSSESSKSQETNPSKSISAVKLILKPRTMDLTDIQLANAFPEIQTFFSFQSWLIFIYEFQIIYPRLVQEFYKNLKCTDEGFQSKVKGIAIDLPTDIATSIFKVPDEGADYHNFEFDLHEAYTIMAGLPADKSDPKQTFVTKFNTNSFPPVLRIIHHMLTTIITPQGGGRDRLTDIQRFILYCMAKDIKINLHVIMYQIISETTRKDLKRSLPYAAHLTSVFQHFGVPLESEKSQSIPKSNIYRFKNIQKFMGFRLEGNQVRRGPVVVEAPQAQQEQPQGQGDQPQGQEEQPPMNEDQPQVSTEGDIPFHAPLSPQFQPPSMHTEFDIPHVSPQPTFQASTSSGGPSVPPELFSFLNDKFETLNTSIQTMSETFELGIQRLENTAIASRGRRGVPTRENEQRREERVGPRREDQGEQQAPAPQGPVLPPPPPVDYGVFMQSLTQAHTQAALQAQLEAQAQASVPQAHDHGGPSIMEKFKRMTPRSFKGESDPFLAESWMREIEKIFRAIRCAEDDKVTLATYMLQK
ncbi:hypothetical protein Taro_054128 [Colocasia esculenta]|uniref:Putative plant transposon protein domain-containing protein n=1 Tax=Colocasia esculenta TaxID=4460 RepID=A0A843XQ59_COLES|nr:hypothetical protein [Colocasia esculenta]